MGFRQFASTTRLALVIITVAVLGVILAITRLWGLGATPAEVSAGEEAFSHVARQIELEGWLGLSHGILDGALTGYAYVLAIWTSLFGDDVGTVRLLSGVASLATLGLSFLLTSILINRRAALFAMLLMAVSIWSLTYARLALPTSLLLLAEIAALYLLFRALYAATDESSRRTMLALSGALVGLGLYFDLAAIVFMVAVLCFWLRVYLLGTVSPRVLGERFATFTVAVVIVSLPFWTAVTTDELIRDEAKALLVTESPRYLQSEGVMDQLRTVTGNVVNTGRALVWNTGSDEFGQGGGRIVDPLTGLLVLVGLLVCIRRGRVDSFGALLVLLIVIVVGVGLTRHEGMFSRLIVAAPIALALAGFAADWLLSWLKGRVPETGIVALIAVIAALVMWFNLTTYYAHPIGAEPTLWLGSVIESTPLQHAITWNVH